MKRVFYIKDSIEHTVSYYHLLAFLLTLPFDRFYSTIVLISFLVHRLIYVGNNSFANINRDVWILPSVFFVSIFSAIYASSFTYALNVITKQLAILLFPLLLITVSSNLAKYRNRLLLGFAWGCAITVCYLFIDAFRVMVYNRMPLRSLLSPSFVHHNFSLPIDVHATYLSMFVTLAFTIFLKHFFRQQQKSSRLLYGICCLALLAGLVQLSSKAAFISLFIVILSFPFFEFRKRGRIKFLVIFLSLFILLSMSLMSVKVFRERLLVDFRNDLVEAPDAERNNWRINRWDAASDLIKQKPILGWGTGSEIRLLKELYFQRKMYASYLNSLNVHNQYLSFLINSGIIGLLIYLATLLWGFWRAVKVRDVALFSFLVVIAVVSFSEDILDVNKGIFFYAFFFSFLILFPPRPAT